MQLEERQEIRGGLNPTIDYQEGLSPRGREYFHAGLKAWKADIEAKLYHKTKDMPIEDVMAETLRERNAYWSDALRHDLDLGPTSLLYAQAQLTMIERACAYLESQPECSDEALHDHLIQSLPEPEMVKVLYVRPEDEVTEEALEAARQDDDAPMAMTVSQENMDYMLGKDSIFQIFKLYRISQFDRLHLTEKKLQLCELRGLNSPTFFSPYDYGQSAINTLSEDMIKAGVTRIEQSQVEDIFFKQAQSFLHLHRNFEARYEQGAADAPPNVQGFFTSLRVVHAFENMQFLMQESFEDQTYDDVLHKLDEGEYSVSIDYGDYVDYCEAKTESRLALIEVNDLDEMLQEGTLNPMDYEDFTQTVYEGFSDESKESYDSYLQKKLDEFASQLALPSVDIREFRQTAKKYRQPRI